MCITNTDEDKQSIEKEHKCEMESPYGTVLFVREIHLNVCQCCVCVDAYSLFSSADITVPQFTDYTYNIFARVNKCTQFFPSFFPRMVWITIVLNLLCALESFVFLLFLSQFMFPIYLPNIQKPPNSFGCVRAVLYSPTFYWYNLFRLLSTLLFETGILTCAKTWIYSSRWSCFLRCLLQCIS